MKKKANFAPSKPRTIHEQANSDDANAVVDSAFEKVSSWINETELLSAALVDDVVNLVASNIAEGILTAPAKVYEAYRSDRSKRVVLPEFLDVRSSSFPETEAERKTRLESKNALHQRQLNYAKITRLSHFGKVAPLPNANTGLSTLPAPFVLRFPLTSRSLLPSHVPSSLSLFPFFPGLISLMYNSYLLFFSHDE